MIKASQSSNMKNSNNFKTQKMTKIATLLTVEETLR